ncbi:MAG: acyl-CoA thioesterase [Gammaproteobacteria bacterium CG_4_10_14_0_8_um_filter_38_16]|nr:MAG: acyl-CoA thioesterase [Gammaproteobacteria bacterium CG_4_10_14_0_8_um_filter_38_16]PJA03805.1 MAG: acyl-CoA thioesterase [Gammaproteobacteria bacterium CG_4_10_14_0_2_um_filter_38_22]PJB10779.1 MAG: acyl-CoA thioesterase [Gammaproteobacteria bacterium CG_4_9_14_3_um_filter_38_9]
MQTRLFSYPLIIKENHLDAFGHVNNAIYLALFEEARWDLITKNGYGLQKIQATGLGPTILEIQLRFLKELRLNEKIIIQTQLVFYKNKIGKLAQKMICNDEVYCEAEFTIGLFSLSERKLVLPTQEWLIAIGVLN